ncbi:glycosyltransferase involved in cell wall biosynthesis [Granulicella aggregans]|uniref:Glycosyltransferase involved in cell wall biosynthesis n=1 Tax=Granulicella aggregans TaxID=474949 RepID=A0A7W7ZEN0_9BACT|nr:glycosyltransferase [Granulicella aggregans]MBB5058476.1 glycosyltransferase involved in cell wall biosynthesis [Granulicella aggregans]
MPVPRVAYFPDSFHEVNGVAHTSRNFEAYAMRGNLPFLCVRAGDRDQSVVQTGEVRSLELMRSRTSIRLEKDLEFDAIFWRHHDAIEWQLKLFKPDIIHVTGPSELGIFGAIFAWKMGLPLAASWHTNVHEYLAKRMRGLTGLLPAERIPGAERGIESATLAATANFYRLAKVLFAPNVELCAMLEKATGKPCHLMQRGVDTSLFTPAKRRRAPEDRNLTLGYVGRLSIEKNIALLVRVAEQLRAMQIEVRFLIVGQGGDEALLREQLPEAEFAGVLRGEALAEAYADMDIFLFPSHTDTFGNVVLEALASGVPAVVTPGGGPKYIVTNELTGFVEKDEDFAASVATLATDRDRLSRMRLAAREYALGCSWDAVFGRVYDAYQTVLNQ